MTLIVPPAFAGDPANSYPANRLRREIAALVTTPRSGLTVAPDTPPGLTVTVGTGWAFVAGSDVAAQGSYFVENDATLDSQPSAAADPALGRVDLLCLRVRDKATDGGSAAADAVELVWVTGTPAASPVAPAAPTSAMVLAEVSRPAGATQIITGQITNRAYGTLATPVGALTAFAGPASRVPVGWLLCDGALVSRLTYAALFDLLGTTWGAGDGTTTFGLPDLRQRVPVGQFVGGDVGAVGGAWDHAHGGGSLVAPSHLHDLGGHAHAIPAHTHGVSTGGPNATYGTPAGSYAAAAGGSHAHSGSTDGGTGGWTGGPSASSGGADRALTITGTSGPANQAYAVVAYIVKT